MCLSAQNAQLDCVGFAVHKVHDLIGKGGKLQVNMLAALGKSPLGERYVRCHKDVTTSDSKPGQCLSAKGIT